MKDENLLILEPNRNIQGSRKDFNLWLKCIKDVLGWNFLPNLKENRVIQRRAAKYELSATLPTKLVAWKKRDASANVLKIHYLKSRKITII